MTSYLFGRLTAWLIGVRQIAEIHPVAISTCTWIPTGYSSDGRKHKGF